MTATWPCTHCGEQHSRRNGSYNRMRTCSEKCADAAVKASRIPKPLPTCAAPGCRNKVKAKRYVTCCRACNAAYKRTLPKPPKTPKAPPAGKLPLRREAITDPEALAPGHLWRLRDEPAPVWRWCGGA